MYNRFRNDNDNESPTVDELRDLIKYEFNPELKPEKQTDFIKFFEKHLLELPNKFNKKTESYVTPGTIQYRTRTLELLKEFKKKIPFEKIDQSFYNEFMAFLKGKKQFSVNTTGKYIRVTKTVLLLAEDEFKIKLVGKKFTVPDEETTVIHLSEPELELMENLDLSKDEKLERVRDLFIIASWTGLRYSDLNQLTKKIGLGESDIVKVKQTKTSNIVSIPILAPVARIINKYNGNLPKVIANATMNEYLKVIGEMIPEFHRLFEVEKSKGNLKIKTDIPIYKLITTHTARRSFATNQYEAGVPVESIMQVTGHRTQKDFFRYIRRESDSGAKDIQRIYNERNRQLKVV